MQRMLPSSRNQIQELPGMRGTPARLAHKEPAEAPWSAAGSARCGGGPPDKSRGGFVSQTRDTTPTGAAAAHPTQDEAMDQETTSSSAIMSSGGEHAKRLADPTEGEIPMSEVKRPRENPVRRILRCPVLWSFLEGCPREMDTTTTHSVHVELRTEQRAHLTWEVPLKRAASPSRVSGAIQKVC